MLASRLATVALALVGLCAVAPAQTQALYTLSRQNRIWRIDGYDTANPTAVLVTQWLPPQDGSTLPSEPLGFDLDPVTGDFLILAGAWFPNPGDFARLIRWDPVSETSTTEWTLPFTALKSLERRWDGKLVSIDDNAAIVTIDPSDGSAISTPMEASIEDLVPLFPPFDLDARGYPQVVGNFTQGSASLQVDPATGAFTATTVPVLPSSIYGSFARANSGELYAATLFPGDLYRYSPTSGAWELVFDNGLLTTNNVYDLLLTNQDDGEGFERICDGLPNSSGVKATMDLVGTSLVGDNDLRLVTFDLPGTTAGFYLMGSAMGSLPVGSGELCIAPTVYRYGASLSVVQDTYSFTADLTALPNGMPAMANTTQIFQFWYRDNDAGLPTSNLSDAVAVRFR